MLRLTILSVLAGWSLLGVIVGALLMILNALKRVRRHMENITMGVRAIETQTEPLGSRAGTLAGRLDEAGVGLGTIAARISEIERRLHTAVPTMRRGE